MVIYNLNLILYNKLIIGYTLVPYINLHSIYKGINRYKVKLYLVVPLVLF